MGRYKTVYADERGEIILVPEIPDPIAAGSVRDQYCNFCLYHEDRDTGQLNASQKCLKVHVGCGGGDVIPIYRHELKEYRARAIVAKMNCAAHPEE